MIYLRVNRALVDYLNDYLVRQLREETPVPKQHQLRIQQQTQASKEYRTKHTSRTTEQQNPRPTNERKERNPKTCDDRYRYEASTSCWIS